MNIDFDLSIFSRLARGAVTELRQKRLWPVAVVLLLACVAVPFLLSNSGSSNPTPSPQAQLPTAPPASGTSIPALNVQTTPSNAHLSGTAHDPFAGTGSGTTSHAATSTPATTGSAPVGSTSSPVTGGTGSLPGAGATSTGASGSGASTSTGVPSSNPPSITHGATPKPAPTGLTATQAYDVSLAMTTSGGGINTTDPLQRLSVIPSEQQPMLVELGVEQGGKHVLFAVQPGTVPSGPGSCAPGPIDCEILSLSQDQTEQLSTQTGSIGSSPVVLFAITGVSAGSYPSAAAADQARRSASSAGRDLLNKNPLSALSLFKYEPSLGSVVNLSNLSVGVS